MHQYPYPLHHELAYIPDPVSAYYSRCRRHHELAYGRTEARTRTEWRHGPQIWLRSDFLPSVVCWGGNKGPGTGRGIQVVK